MHCCIVRHTIYNGVASIAASLHARTRYHTIRMLRESKVYIIHINAFHKPLWCDTTSHYPWLFSLTLSLHLTHNNKKKTVLFFRFLLSYIFSSLACFFAFSIFPLAPTLLLPTAKERSVWNGLRPQI